MVLDACRRPGGIPALLIRRAIHAAGIMEVNGTLKMRSLLWGNRYLDLQKGLAAVAGQGYVDLIYLIDISLYF